MTEFVEVKTQDLSGAALDWAVAKAEGVEISLSGAHPHAVVDGRLVGNYAPSTKWSQGGPLLDKHCKVFGLSQDGTGTNWRAFAYKGKVGEVQFQRLAAGPSILRAACRAIVVLHIGDVLSVPKELLS